MARGTRYSGFELKQFSVWCGGNDERTIARVILGKAPDTPASRHIRAVLAARGIHCSGPVRHLPAATQAAQNTNGGGLVA